MIQVTKRNGQIETFNADRLRLAIWRALGGDWPHFMAAHHFSRAIGIYLARRRVSSVTSGALFEMAVLTLERADCRAAAAQMEAHRDRRRAARERCVVMTADGSEKPWSRDELTEAVRLRWDISEQAARAISAQLENETIHHFDHLDEEALLDAADEMVENYGLAPWCLMAALPGGGEN